MTEIIAHTFSTGIQLAHWLEDAANIEALITQYPPDAHKARIDLNNKQIIVTVLKDVPVQTSKGEKVVFDKVYQIKETNGEKNSSGEQPDSVGSKKDLGDDRR